MTAHQSQRWALRSVGLPSCEADTILNNETGTRMHSKLHCLFHSYSSKVHPSTSMHVTLLRRDARFESQMVCILGEKVECLFATLSPYIRTMDASSSTVSSHTYKYWKSHKPNGVKLWEAFKLVLTRVCHSKSTLTP